MAESIIHSVYFFFAEEGFEGGEAGFDFPPGLGPAPLIGRAPRPNLLAVLKSIRRTAPLFAALAIAS